MEFGKQLSAQSAERLMLALITSGAITPSHSPRVAAAYFDKAARQMLIVTGMLDEPTADD